MMDAPSGYVRVAEPEGDDWRLVDGYRLCRSMSFGGRDRCPNAAVVELNRSRRHKLVTRPQWWPYCADHMYGRWIENGRVMTHVLRPARKC